MVKLYTDGSCVRNGRSGSRGGYAAVYPDFMEDSFGSPLDETASQTNQTAELTAIREGLLKLTRLTDTHEQIVKIYTDSEYSINCLTKWVVSWKKKDWKTSEGKPVVHRELIEEILNILKNFAGHQFFHVKAHTGLSDEDSKFNDAADKLARRSVEEGRTMTYKDIEEVKVIHSSRNAPVLEGIPLAIMGSPIKEETLFKSIMENMSCLNERHLTSALIGALKKTLAGMNYDIEKVRIHRDVMYRLVEKTHLTIERTEE